MKILYAPYNIASMPAITVEEFNKIENVKARGICIDPNKYLYFGKEGSNEWKKFHVDSNISKNWFLFLYNLVLAEIFLIYRILWSDVIIWQWDIKKYMPHYWLIKILKKPIFVEWLGSDIRNPDFVKLHNPYYKFYFDSGQYGYLKESSLRSQNIQLKFNALNAIPILCPEMSLYLDKKLFPTYIELFQRINVYDYKPIFPHVTELKPIICHAPSLIGAKGTTQLRIVIEKIKPKYEFHYIEITNKSRSDAIKAIESCDIFLDQFILGAYGMASCEAMSMGKPVFCYIMPPVKKALPPDCPIISTNLDNLESELIKYVTNAKLRNEVGINSRKYVEKYHDSEKISRFLLKKIII